VISLRERAALHEAGEVVEVGRITPRHWDNQARVVIVRHCYQGIFGANREFN